MGTGADGADLTIVVPVWRRTSNLDRLLTSAQGTVPEAQVLLVGSDGDELARPAIGELVTAGRAEALWIAGVGGEHGDYARKINAGYRASVRPLIFTGADDIVFQPGWYEPARALIDEGEIAALKIGENAVLIGPLPVPTVGVVGTVDDLNGRTMLGEHSTHTLVARWYADHGGSVDQSNMIYDEGYPHDYVDDELVQTAMARCAYAHSYESHVSHIHVLADSSLDDEVYRHGRSRARIGRQRFHLRKRIWGGGW